MGDYLEFGLELVNLYCEVIKRFMADTLLNDALPASLLAEPAYR